VRWQAGEERRGNLVRQLADHDFALPQNIPYPHLGPSSPPIEADHQDDIN